jgi:hypothetical protein
VVGDPDRKAYRAFGLERTSWLTFLNPSMIWGYLRQKFKGVGIKMLTMREDVLQLGGDFILDRSGNVVWKFTSRNPTARPSVDQLLAVLGSAPTGS